MNNNLLSESVPLGVNSSFPAVCTRLLWMLESQSSILVPLLMVMVSCRPVGFVAAIVQACPVVVILAVPSPADSTIGPYVNATAL